MHNFLVKQRLHLLVLPLYALARLTMDQWMFKFVPLSFSSQMYFESVVSFRWLLCLRETLHVTVEACFESVFCHPDINFFPVCCQLLLWLCKLGCRLGIGRRGGTSLVFSNCSFWFGSIPLAGLIFSDCAP